MSLDLPPDSVQPALPGLADRVEQARTYLRSSKAPNSLRAYRADLAEFTLWCTKHGLEHRPPSLRTVSLYITALGEAGAFRRAELVTLDVEDLTETEDGLRVLIRKSKTDQEGEGREVGIPFGQHPKTCSA